MLLYIIRGIKTIPLFLKNIIYKSVLLFCGNGQYLIKTFMNLYFIIIKHLLMKLIVRYQLKVINKCF